MNIGLVPLLVGRGHTVTGFVRREADADWLHGLGAKAVRGDVFVRRVLFKDTKAVGVEVESGGALFTVEAERVVLSAGAIKAGAGSPSVGGGSHKGTKTLAAIGLTPLG